jgi:hypothetical protein
VALCVGIVVQFCYMERITHMPLMKQLFDSQSLDGPAWLLVLTFSLLVLLVVGIEKFSQGKLSGGKKTC